MVEKDARLIRSISRHKLTQRRQQYEDLKDNVDCGVLLIPSANGAETKGDGFPSARHDDDPAKFLHAMTH